MNMNIAVAMILGLPVVLLGFAVNMTKGKVQITLLVSQVVLLAVQIGFFIASFT